MTTPNAKERALIARYRPRIFLPDDHPGFIDYSSGHIAHGGLYDGQGEFTADAVTQETPDHFKRDAKAEFRHQPWLTAAGGPSPLPASPTAPEGPST